MIVKIITAKVKFKKKINDKIKIFCRILCEI